MNNRWLTILLFVSLCFNIAVMASFIYIRSTHPRPEMCRPDMPPHQGRYPGEQLVRRFDQQTKAELRSQRDAFMDAKKDLMETLAQPEVDYNKAQALLDSSLALHRDLEENIGRKIIENRKNMTAKEAKEYFSPEENPFPGQHRKPKRRYK